MKKITFRNGHIGDLEELQQLFVETVRSICSADYAPRQIEVWTSSIKNEKRWNEIMTTQWILVAQVENKIVGFATLEKNNYIDLFYVHKDYQGKGIANKLFKKTEEEAKRLGQKELTSNVSKTAKPFFEKIGFELITKQTVVRQGVKFTNFKMIKRINKARL